MDSLNTATHKSLICAFKNPLFNILGPDWPELELHLHKQTHGCDSEFSIGSPPAGLRQTKGCRPDSNPAVGGGRCCNEPGSVFLVDVSSERLSVGPDERPRQQTRRTCAEAGKEVAG